MTLALLFTPHLFESPAISQLTGIQSSPIVPTVEDRVSQRPGNREGTVLIVMYHRTGGEEKYMVRSRKNFLADLERLYRLNYRPVTLAEYGSNSMKLPRGASPVVITFDDSDSSQFSLTSQGKVDQNTMVGIWQKFAETHPDFPVKGTFFVLPNGPFGRKKDAPQKLEMLKKWGSEIGSHTMTHRALDKITDQEVSAELGKSYEYIKSLGFEPTSMALPYGNMPRNHSLLKSFTYGTKKYRYWNIVKAGSEPAPSPLSPRFDSTRIPRVLAYDGEQGLNWWLDYNKRFPKKPYVQP